MKRVIRGWMNPMNGVVIDPLKKKSMGVGNGYPNFSVPLYEEPTAEVKSSWNAALDQASAIVLADCVNPPKTEYQVQYNATLKSTAAQILKLKEST